MLPSERVENEIRRRIQTGIYQPSEKMPGEEEVGVDLGVSRQTVSKALAPLVAEGLIVRTRGRGTFVAEQPLRQAPAPVADPLMLYISPGSRDQGMMIRHGVLEGMHAVLDPENYRVGIDFYADIAQQLKCLTFADDKRYAGLVFWPNPGPETSAIVRTLITRGFPIVLVDTYLPAVETDYAVTDNIAGAAEMVDYLVGLGHRNILYLTETPSRSSLIDRTTGFLRGMIAHGLSPAKSPVLELPSFSEAEIEMCVARALAREPAPTAFFASNDTLAMGIMRVLFHRGIQVPRDLSVVGFDGIGLAEHLPVPLTTMAQNFIEMGRTAAHILLERLGNGNGKMRFQKLLAPSLQIRQSAAPPRLLSPEPPPKKGFNHEQTIHPVRARTDHSAGRPDCCGRVL